MGVQITIIGLDRVGLVSWNGFKELQESCFTGGF